MSGDEADDPVVTREALRREEAFAEHAADVETSEEITGVYGHGVVRDVVLGDEVDEYVLEAPDGTESVLRFDANPSTKRCRTYAFLELLDVPFERQLDAIGRRGPFVYVRETDEWVPAFPGRNRSLVHAQFRVLSTLLRYRLYEFTLRDDREYNSRTEPHFEMRAWVFWALFLCLSTVTYVLAFGGGILAVAGSLLGGGLAILSVFVAMDWLLFIRCGTVAKFDAEAVAAADDAGATDPAMSEMESE